MVTIFATLLAVEIPTPDSIIESLLAATLGPTSIVLVAFVVFRSLQSWITTVRSVGRAASTAGRAATKAGRSITLTPPTTLVLATVSTAIVALSQVAFTALSYLYGNWTSQFLKSDEWTASLANEGIDSIRYESLWEGWTLDWVSGSFVVFAVLGSLYAYSAEDATKGGSAMAAPSIVAGVLVGVPAILIAIIVFLIGLVVLVFDGFGVLRDEIDRVLFGGDDVLGIFFLFFLYVAHLIVAYVIATMATSVSSLWQLPTASRTQRPPGIT